jgi:hypothetical protein
MSKIFYTDDFELILKEEAEKAESMSILHSKANAKFQQFSVGLNIPVIVLSGSVGFLNAINLFPDQNIFLGAISIFIGLIKTIDSYFDYTKRCETHRMVSLAYYKISKFIQLQLSLKRECRIEASDLYKLIVNDIQNIKDSEPLIPLDIIKDFNKQYKDENTKKPNMCNGLTDIHINKSPRVLNINLENEEDDIKINF